MWLFQTFSWNIPRQKKDVKQSFDVVWPWFQYILPAQSQVWVSCDPVTRVKALNWQDLDRKFPFSMPLLSLPLERVSFNKNSHPTIQVPFMPCFRVPRPDLKAHGIHVKAGFEEIHPRVVKVGLLHTVLRQARYHGWPRGHICCVRWVWRRLKCCWRTCSKRNTCGDVTKVECKPSGCNLLGRWNPEIQPKTINKKRRFSDIWFDMHWSNFWLPVF